MLSCLWEYAKIYISTCCQEPHSASTSPCSQTREVAPRGTWSLPPRPGGPAPRATRQRGKSKQVYCRPPGPPPHTAAEAPAGHGLDPALWTSLTLASDLNIWQQADKGCSGNSLCRCQQPHPLQALQGVFTSTLSPSSSGPPALLSFLSLCFSQSLFLHSFSFPLPLPFLLSSLSPPTPTPHPHSPLLSVSVCFSLPLSGHLCVLHCQEVSFALLSFSVSLWFLSVFLPCTPNPA